MQPHGRGTRSTVKGERDGAFGFIPYAIFCISDEEDLGARFLDLRIFFLVVDFFLQHHCPGGDGVLNHLAADLDRMLALDQIIFGSGFFVFLLFGFGFSLLGHVSLLGSRKIHFP